MPLLMPVAALEAQLELVHRILFVVQSGAEIRLCLRGGCAREETRERHERDTESSESHAPRTAAVVRRAPKWANGQPLTTLGHFLWKFQISNGTFLHNAKPETSRDQGRACLR